MIKRLCLRLRGLRKSIAEQLRAIFPAHDSDRSEHSKVPVSEPNNIDDIKELIQVLEQAAAVAKLQER